MGAFAHGLGNLCVKNTNFPLHFSFSEISKNYIRFLSGKMCTLSNYFKKLGLIYFILK